jgi:CubicO group peptidase (beta-lactamase class C family)
MKRILFTFFISILLISKGYSQITIDTSKFVKNNHQLYSVVVSQDDRIIYNKYFNGKSAKELFNDQSLTKSVMSLLIGIAIDKGFISSVDEKIVKFFPQLKNDADKRKQEITLRALMNQASGFWHEDLAKLGDYLKIPDPSGTVLNAPLISEPGKVFRYNNAATHLLSVIITKSTGITTLQFANKYLFEPLGIKNVTWEKMNDGYYDGCGLLGVHLSTLDMNRIGSLVLHNGYFNNKRVVSEKWIAQTLQPAAFYSTPWGFPGSAYALCWYHYTYKGTPVSYGLGWGGQFVFIIPGKKTVITVNSSVDNATAVKASNLFMDMIFPLIYQELK